MREFSSVTFDQCHRTDHCTDYLPCSECHFTEAFLSFIGIGISAPMASWGSMAQDARQVLTMHPGQLLLPTICICITIFSLNFLGEGIGDAFNPKKTRG